MTNTVETGFSTSHTGKVLNLSELNPENPLESPDRDNTSHNVPEIIIVNADNLRNLLKTNDPAKRPVTAINQAEARGNAACWHG
jgi:hypothetical protein